MNHLVSRLAPLALSLGLADAAFAQSLEPTNLGPMRANVFTGHVLTPPPAPGADGVATTRILYCPSESDDAALRANISAAAGGAPVDYFDARAATPSIALLTTYDVIYTWANFGYFDNVTLGNRLALACDNGKNIVLGVFCTYTTGNFLSGAIMNPAYCPVVSPTGTNHFATSPYVQDGITCIYSGVTTLDSTYRDFLTVQGTGIADGTAADGEIVHAYRPNPGLGAGAIVYQNGSGAIQLGGSGQWDVAVANAGLCYPGANPGSCTFRNGVLGLNPVGYDCATAPSAGLTWNSTVDTTPSVGTTTLQTYVVLGVSGPFDNSVLFGYELLTLPPYVLDPGFGNHSNPIPLGTSGFQLYTQGARLETDSTGGAYIVLLNAQDLVVG